MEDIKNYLEFQEIRIIGLSLTNENPTLLALNKKKVESFKELRLKCLFNGEVCIDIPKITK